MKLTVLCFITLLAAQVGIAQSDSGLNKRNRKASEAKFTPAMTLQNPLGGGELGFISLGASLQSKTRLSNHVDGSAAVYVGLGDPTRYIGAGATIYFYGLSNSVGERNNRGHGALHLHLNKFLFKKKLLLDVGVDNVYRWGEIRRIKDYITYNTSRYFSANYLFNLKSEEASSPFKYLSVTAGMGNGYFRSDDNFIKKGPKGFDPFLSLATPLCSSTNFIAEWNGYDIGTGISSIPFKRIPFMLALEVTDILYGSPRINTSLSVPFQLFKFNKRSNLSPYRPVGVKFIRTERTI